MAQTGFPTTLSQLYFKIWIGLSLVFVGLFDGYQSLSLTRSDQEQNLFFGSLNDAHSDYGMPVQVEFLTKLRSKRDLSIHPYHIIQISSMHQHSSVSIHLTKDEEIISDRFKAVVIGENDQSFLKSDLNCLYSGVISGSQGGYAALSTCDTNEGFTGHFILGDEHYTIEPDHSQPKSLNTSTSNPTIHHRVYRSSTILLQQLANATGRAHVAHRVPQDEYNQAIAGFVNTSRFDDMEDEESEEEKTHHQNDTGNSDHNNVPSDISHINSFYTDDSPSSELDVNAFTVGKIALNSQPKSSGQRKKNKGVPKQMPAKGKKVMEIAVFTDPELFKLWATRYPKDTKDKLKSYVLNLVNNMNLLYKQPSLGVDISFRLVYLEMMASTYTKAPQNFEGESEKYLTAFCKYAGEKNSKGADWDHATLLSGINLKDGQDKSLAGLAWFSTMCLRFWSCSVSEAFSFGSTFVLAHEIGHSLGMEHDGTKPNTACSPDKYLMSPYTGEGRVTWSSCSTKNVREYLAKGTSTGEKGAIPFCLTKASPIKAKSVPFGNPSGKLPGDVYKASVQCQYDCGTTCTPNMKKSESFCKILSCSKPGTPGFTITKDAHPALEGTSCGKGKICKHGKCVKSGSGGGNSKSG